MKRGVFQKSRVALLAAACLAMSMPVWANSRTKTETLSVYLEGVTRNGCLTDCGGQCDPFCAVINTCTGEFTGKAVGCVENCSHCRECYRCVNFFTNCCVTISSSEYTVTSCGDACYVACGCLKSSSSGSSGQSS